VEDACRALELAPPAAARQGCALMHSDRVAAVRAFVVSGGGADYHDQEAGH